MNLEKTHPQKVQHILITRLDNIGDVVFTLPLVGLIRAHYPQAKISFLGTGYTKALLYSCPDVDQVWDWTALQLFSNAEIVNRFKAAGITTIIHLSQSKRVATLARRAGIPFRVTNLKGLPNWFYCNRWVNLPDERIDLHEAERNIKMLKPLGIQPKLERSEIASYIRLNPANSIPAHVESLLDKNCFNLILHPGSNGHGCEWPVAYFKQLIKVLSEKHPGKFKIFITGGPQERERFEDLVKETSAYAIDLIGAMQLPEFLTFLSRVDGLVASGTGPLHVSAALGIKTLGLFPPKKGISLTRWAPLGKQAEALVCDHTEPCTTCPGSTSCFCMTKIPVQQVLSILERWLP